MDEALRRSGVPAIAVTLALVLLAGVVLAALGGGTAGAATVLHRGDDVVVQHDDGTSTPLAVGEEVPRGAVVVAGRDGGVLRTRDRDTWLGGGSAVQVLDGARQELRVGLVMVDARRGPGLELTTTAAEVTTPSGAVSRVEGGPLLRVGAYDGDPLSVQPVGRRATTPVATDYQVQVPESALPGRVTPLVLTPDDPYERALAPRLVAADEALGDLAARLDAGGEPALAVRTVADNDVPTAPLPPGAPASERTLAYLLARAAGGELAERPLGERYALVRELRGDGGSWGVVADLVDGQVSDVAALLDELLAPAETALVADGTDPEALLALLAGPLAGTASAAPSPPSSVAPPTTGRPPAPPTGDEPGDEPPPPPDRNPLPPVQEDVDAVLDEVVDTVFDLLPADDEPGPDEPASAPVPVPLPLPVPLLSP